MTGTTDVALQIAAARIAVLPFENLSGEAADAYFARGFVEDLIVELSRFPTIEVLHPDSSLVVPDGHAVLAHSAVSHFLRGSVRRTTDAVRVTAQLVDASSGAHLWAQHLDAPAADVFALQDEIVARVASTIAIEIDSARHACARRKPLASLEVYDCWLRGLAALRRGTRDDDVQARVFFERALEIDPEYARAHAGLSLSHFNEWSCQAWELWDEKERCAFEHARRAAALDDTDAQVQTVLARVLLYRREFEPAERHIDRALELNPSDADVLAHAGLCRAYLGNPESGMELARKAIRLHPRHPEFYVPSLAVPLFVLGRYAEAAEIGSRAPRAFIDVPAYLAAGAALDGKQEAAEGHLDTFLADYRDKILFDSELEPGDPLRWLELVNPYRRREDFEKLAQGLERAGLPAEPARSVVTQGRRAPAPWRGGAPTHRPGQRPSFRREGPLWEISFGGETVRVNDAKGFGDLVSLLSRPGDDVHCLELVGRPNEARGADPMLDDRARREIRQRIEDLEQQIDEAEQHADPARAERVREELDQLVTSLAGALGLGGRPRRVGSAVERARSTVTWRIRSAIRKLAVMHPSLGRHLENAVRTGTRCVYQPEAPVDWHL